MDNQPPPPGRPRASLQSPATLGSGSPPLHAPGHGRSTASSCRAAPAASPCPPGIPEPRRHAAEPPRPPLVLPPRLLRLLLVPVLTARASSARSARSPQPPAAAAAATGAGAGSGHPRREGRRFAQPARLGSGLDSGQADPSAAPWHAALTPRAQGRAPQIEVRDRAPLSKVLRPQPRDPGGARG